MIVIPKSDPFPHIILDETFTDQEYDLVFKEILFLMPKMQTPDNTAASMDVDGRYKKKGLGVFIDDVYSDRKFSDIANFTRKMFRDDVRMAADSMDLYFKLYNKLVNDAVLVQLYYNGDYYKSHIDESLFTAVTLMHKTPKKYSGGELVFPGYEYNPNLKNNQSIIFPSLIRHEVTEVKLQTSDPTDGRFTVSQLMALGTR